MTAGTFSDDDSAGGGDLTMTTIPPDQDEHVLEAPQRRGREFNWVSIATVVLQAVALILFMIAGYLKWADSSIRESQTARVESVQAARDGTVALLSYTPADVDKQLAAARDLLTGDFRNSYTTLTEDVVIPGAKQQKINAVATVPAASSVSANAKHAVALVFVNQTTTVGSTAPTTLTSAVSVGLEKVDGRWLISKF
ncbi:MAG: hypothetical protein ACR2JI_13775, partial [Mycobacterium sp.]